MACTNPLLQCIAAGDELHLTSGSAEEGEELGDRIGGPQWKDDLTPVISRMFLHIRRWRSRHQVAARQLLLMVLHLTRTM